MKKVTKFLSLLLMLTLAIVFVSCGDPIEISFADESIEIEFEATEQLDFTVSDEELELEWSVSDPTILEVTQTGSVKGLKAGTTTVTVKVKGEDVEATISVTVKPKPVINPTTVVISDSVSEGKVGESYTFKATVLPAGADQGVTWASSDEEVATVSATGVVNLLSIGEVTISATSTKDNTKKQTVDINVLAPDPTSITITSEENVTEVNVFATLQFSASVSPDIAVAEVSWSVSDDALASIDANGKLTAKQPGTVTVTATSTVASTVSDTFELTIVQPDPEEVVVDKESATLEVDEEITLSANVLPSIAIQSVTFTSSDEDVATVDENGKVTAIGAGEAVITITATAKTSVTKTVNIKVIDVSLIEYDVEFVLLDEAITADRFEKITVDEKEFYVGLNAFTVASEAFAVLEDDSTLIIKKGTYSGATKVTASGVTILGPNAGKPAGKDLSNRVDEAVFSGVMTFDGAEDILIDGIAISGAAQIKFVKATKNVTIQNLNSFSPGIPAGEGVIFAQAATATDLNENFVIRNSSFVDSSGYDGAGPGGGFRAIRINNAKDLEITDNFLVGFYDTIRLEGEGNAGAGAGYGASGSIKINNNRFENNFQYPIWIGTHRLSDIEVFDNYLGTRKDYAGSGYGVYGYIYIVGFKPTAEFKAVVNVLRNEMPYQVPGWHQFRFNSGGATPEQLEINANFNIFHENASYPDGDYYHIADHFADSDTGFRINGKDNYFLYEGDIIPEYFLRTNYEPLFRELGPTEADPTKLLVDPTLEAEDDELILVDSITYQVGLTAFTTLAAAMEKLIDGATLTIKAGTYTDAITIDKNNVTVVGPNKGIKADKAMTNRVDEAIFTAVITVSGVSDLTIDGIQLKGSGRIRSASPVQNVMIKNLSTLDSVHDGSEGIVFFGAATAADTNDNIIIKDSSFDDSKLTGSRGIRIRNGKDVQIIDNYFYGYFDAMVLEGNGGGAGVGQGMTGTLVVSRNEFEMNFQYPIRINAHSTTTTEIDKNKISVDASKESGIYGLIYVWYVPVTDLVTVVNVTNNEIIYNATYHEIRINSGGATNDQLTVNVNYNIWHEIPAVDSFHIVDGYANSTFDINGKHNVFLYETDVLDTYFSNTTYQPYYRTVEELVIE